MQNIIQIANGILIGGVGGGGGGVDPFVGLLDAYPGAAAAYSVRQLSSTYTAPTASEFSFGNALEFDGVNDYVSIPSINLSTLNFTISFWNKGGNQVGVFGDNGNGYFQLVNTNGGIIINILLNLPSMGFLNPVRDNNTWYNYVITSDNNIMRCYVNSVESTSGGLSTGGVKSGSITKIGARGSIAFINANMDEVAMWDVALNTEQISNLYNSGNGDYATNYSPENLVAYWRMNESGTDTTLTDETGNYNGTLNGFTVPDAWVNGKANNGALVEIAGYTTTPTFVENRTFYPDTNNELSLSSTDALGTTLATWLSTNSITDGYVRTWYDQSGNANNATQTTASAQPKIITAGTFTLENGKPLISYIDGATQLDTPTAGSATSWRFGVVRVPVGVISVLYSEPSNSNYVCVANNGSGNTFVTGATLNNIYVNGVAITASRTSFYNNLLISGLLTLDIEDSLFSTINFGYTPSSIVGMLNMQEMIFYSTNQSANKIGIETNINNYYNIYSPPIGAFSSAFSNAFNIT